jgi:predicted nucleotide-binding protein
MTTPTGGDDWVTAREAAELLPHSTRAICIHAKEGLVRARARVLVWGGERRNDADVPPEFWWAEGDEALEQDWRTGHFVTWIRNGTVRLEAFMVEFRRLDIQQLRPKSAATPTAPPSPVRRLAKRTVFIGHGHSAEWRKLSLFLRDEHDLSVIEFNSSSPVGISTTEHLQAMLNQADFAFLILTGEDEQATGELNPRLNVVHEAGLFQGKLGFRKAILFLEEGCQDFSNVRGLTPIGFPKGEIDARFHEATRVLKREELIS